jgi:glycosyltransferase involved in cell wall biosynthesis
VRFLLKAWQQVHAKDPLARLAIVGTGERDMVQAVKNQVLALGLQSAVFLELRFVSLPELHDFFDAADILVYPYSEVTTSGALLTGVVRGKAVVASQLPAFERILRQGETALLVPYGDVDALAASLLRLVGDADLRHSLGARLRDSQASLPRWDEIAGQTCDCYRVAIAECWHGVGQTARV